jgi:hypothetical protein
VPKHLPGKLSYRMNHWGFHRGSVNQNYLVSAPLTS